MRLKHKCGFWYDSFVNGSFVTINSGSIHFNESLGVLIGLSQDYDKLNNISSFISDDTICYFKDTRSSVIFSKSNNTWYDL